MRPFHERRPTEDAAIGRAQQSARHTMPATAGQLRDRLRAARTTRDIRGCSILLALVAKAVA